MLSLSWWLFCWNVRMVAHLFIFADVIPQIMSPYIFWCYIISRYTCLFSNLLVFLLITRVCSVYYIRYYFLMLTKQKYTYVIQVDMFPMFNTLMWEYRECLQKYVLFKFLQWLWFDGREIDISITHVTLLPVHMLF